jgi:hypothetical protein
MFMTIQQTKDQLIYSLQNKQLKVVALSGDWGTGKTHLWKEIRNQSSIDLIKDARYVSLFGVKDINQLKFKVVQSALPVGGESDSLTESLLKAWKIGSDALKKVHEGFTALDEIALIGVPLALKNRLVVIDDIERKHAKLSVDEILGFVDEYSQNFGTRFLLILNSDRFLSVDDNSLWTVFREKVVEEELRFTPTAFEAFDIAVPDTNDPYRDVAREAINACGITNIRVIRQAFRLVHRLLDPKPDLHLDILKRTVPSIILIAALQNKAIRDGPSLDFVANYNNGSDLWLERYVVAKTGADLKKNQNVVPASWKLLLSKLGIKSADEFERLVVNYVRDGKHDSVAFDEVLRQYRNNKEVLDAGAAAHDFLERFAWSVHDSDDELLHDAEKLILNAPYLSAQTVSTLHKRIAELPNGVLIAEQILDVWIEKFEKSTDISALGISWYENNLNERIKEVVSKARIRSDNDMSVFDAIKYIHTHQSWGRREEMVLRSASIEDFQNALISLRGGDFKIFVLKCLDILEFKETYERHFGDAGMNFLFACRLVLKSDTKSRFAQLIRALFAESKVADLLEANGG